MEFRKYHGLGNDFLVVDARDPDDPTPAALTPEVVRHLCDRRRGIGGDGVLLVRRGRTAPFAMVVHNADGSLAEMCGNGLRCVARFAHDHLGAGAAFVVETGAGPRAVRVGPEDVRVEMGAAHDGGDVVVDIDGRPVTGRAVRTGNPHLVLYGEWDAGAAERLGPRLERHPAFPDGVNVSFARRRGPRHVELVVWERGCGRTLACGTGACATVAAGRWAERLAGGDDEVRVDLPGGTLYVGGRPEALTMRGPAVEVFRGWVDLSRAA